KVIENFKASRKAFRDGGRNNGVDIVWSTVDAFAREYPTLRGLQPVAIMQYDWSRGGDAIVVDGNRIKSVTDLKGKTIVVLVDSPSYYFALMVLQEAGLNRSDVQWRYAKSALQAANYFKTGKTDAMVSWSPDVYIAAKDRPGGKILMSTRASRISWSMNII
ncbi:MAG: PhnD/SsuA/transferrin family substrate-binding protein, partial [bacterium]